MMLKKNKTEQRDITPQTTNQKLYHYFLDWETEDFFLFPLLLQAAAEIFTKMTPRQFPATSSCNSSLTDRPTF